MASEKTTQAEASMATALVPQVAAQAQIVQDEATGCCIVGGGPAGLRIPWFVRAFTRIPILRDIPPRIMALGVVRVRVEN
jgi:hypothetical protein